MAKIKEKAFRDISLERAYTPQNSVYVYCLEENFQILERLLKLMSSKATKTQQLKHRVTLSLATSVTYKEEKQSTWLKWLAKENMGGKNTSKTLVIWHLLG